MSEPLSKRETIRDRLESGMHEARRRQARVTVRLGVLIKHEAGDAQGIALDIGLGGMFIETDVALDYGAQIEVLLALPRVPEPMRLPGIVRWTKPQGIGLQFLELSARQTYAIASLVMWLKARALEGA